MSSSSSHAIKCLDRQWHRHRTWAFNELSARYRELPNEYYIPDSAIIGVQSTDNKQGRALKGTHLDCYASLEEQRRSELAGFKRTCDEAFQYYHYLLRSGWPRELARSVLPVNTYSHMFSTVNLLNLMKFLTLRCDAHAQFEIREYAGVLAGLAKTVVPAAMAAWEQERKA